MLPSLPWQALVLVDKIVAIGLLGGIGPHDAAPLRLEDPGGKTLPARASSFLLEMESLLLISLGL